MPVAHMVWIKFAEDVPQDRIEAHLDALKSLSKSVPGILELTLGENFTDRAQGYTHGLLVVLADKPGLKVYAEHPEHVAVASALREDASLMALDYEFPR